MTTKQANAAELARIGDCDYVIQQASAEGLVLRGERNDWRANALERAAELFLAGEYRASRRMAKQFEEA